MIKFEKVTKVFPKNFVALDNITLDVGQGEFVSIIGHSGSGKSTLLKLIYAEEVPTKGRVFFLERPLDSIKRRLLPYYRRNIGTVFQDFKLLQNKTVFENVAYALEVYGYSNSVIEKEVPKILDIVGLLDKMNYYPYQLSGGEQQRVSLARALIHRPKVLIADEPTGNLDPQSTWDIVELLMKINDFGTTVLLASHDRDVIDRIGRRVVTLENGRVVRDVKKGKYT